MPPQRPEGPPWAFVTALVVTGVLVGAALTTLWWLPTRWLTATSSHTQVSTAEPPRVLRTPGGLLEVARLETTERFSRRDTRSFWGIDLGETVTEITVPASYRYQLPLARQWPINLADGVVTVDAPAFAPSLPVAFDTTRMQTWGRTGWARFNKAESLAALQRSITPQLAQRAASPTYRAWVTEAARRTVAEYVRSWLVHAGHGPVREVRVRFPGEAQATAPREATASIASP